jgi:hypothetical protein
MRAMKGTPVLDLYEQLLSPYRQRRYQQLGVLHAFCPHCQRWRVHGHALGEGNTVKRASHCVDCPTVRTGYQLRIVGPWNASVRRTRRVMQQTSTPPLRADPPGE